MTSYLIDTNHASVFMAKAEESRQMIATRAHQGDTFAISVTVLGELYFAAFASRRIQQNLANIAHLLAYIPVLPFDQAAAEEYGRIRAELKAKGRPIPSTDVQIAAVARLHGLTVLSVDRHFRFVDNVRVENWL